jgi:acyl dehydratase
VDIELKVTPDKYLPHRYAGASGDFNPIHIDPQFAQEVVRGTWTNIVRGV